MGELIRFHGRAEQKTKPRPPRKERPLKPEIIQAMHDFRRQLDETVDKVERGDSETAFLYDFIPNRKDYILASPDGKSQRIPISLFMQVIEEFQDSLGYVREGWTESQTLLDKKTIVRIDVHDCSKKDGIELEERKIFNRGFHHVHTSAWITRQSYRLIQGGRMSEAGGHN